MNTFEEIVSIMTGLRDIDIDSVRPETTFAELGFDSMDRIELIMAIEDRYGLNLEDVGEIRTIGEACKLIART